MLSRHIYYICATWISKEVGTLKSSNGGNGKSQKQEELLWAAIKNLPRELTTELLYLKLPTYFSLLWCKKIYAIHMILS